jgi:hypothetical protein
MQPKDNRQSIYLRFAKEKEVFLTPPRPWKGKGREGVARRALGFPKIQTWCG